MNEPITIEIWSDVVCPWCCIGKKSLEKALASYQGPVHLVFRSFQLEPDAPVDSGERVLSMLQRKYGVGEAQARLMMGRVTEMARSLGLEYHLEDTLVTNTREAHQLVHLAADRGLSGRVLDRLYRAYFTENLDIGRSGTLIRLAGEAGLDQAEALDCLDQGLHEDQVARDQARARELGIQGVPFYLFNEDFGFSGAQPSGVFERALARAAGPSLRPLKP